MIARFRLIAAVALSPVAMATPAAHAQFLLDETATVERGKAPSPSALPAGEVGEVGEVGEAPAPDIGVTAGLPGNIGNQTIRDVAERVVGRKRAGQVGQIEAVARDVLGKDPAGAASSVGVAEVLPLVGEAVKGLGKKKKQA